MAKQTNIILTDNASECIICIQNRLKDATKADIASAALEQFYQQPSSVQDRWIASVQKQKLKSTEKETTEE